MAKAEYDTLGKHFVEREKEVIELKKKIQPLIRVFLKESGGVGIG